MTAIGAAATAVCVLLVILAAGPRSQVVRHLNILRPSSTTVFARLRVGRLIAPTTLGASGLALTMEQLLAVKIVAAFLGALVAAIVGLAIPIGPIVLLGTSYLGFVLPSIYVERQAARRRSEAESAIASFVEWAHALILSGRPVDSALIALARRGTGALLVDRVLGRVADLYTLGAPLHVSLVRESKDAGLVSLARIAERLERARELGHGSVSVLADARDELRSAGRERLLQSASGVEGKITLILTLCYLPALALLVIVPLFVTLLAGLFG